jgi:hypothetical protein
MASDRLEVISATGDETIGRYRWVVHGASNATEAVSILDGGLSFIEGRPTFSTNLVHAHEWTVNSEKQRQSLGTGSVEGQPGKIIFLAVPSNFHLGHGTFTGAFIDRSLKHVGGQPLRYASARKQLALYTRADTEERRVHIEAEAAAGLSLEVRTHELVEPEFILGSLAPGPGVDAVIKQLGVTIGDLQELNYGSFQSALLESARPVSASKRQDLAYAIAQLLEGTVESVIMSRLRMLRWKQLATQGYSFSEGRQQVTVDVQGTPEQTVAHIEEYGRRLAESQLLSGNLSWLKAYSARRIELIKVEAEGSRDAGAHP